VNPSKICAVTVVIVTYRSAQLTIDCLRSLLPECTASDILLRAVVVDNASGDAPDVAKAIEQHGWGSWVTLIEAPKNGGFAYGNNMGFAHALKTGSPDYFHLLNPDTVVKPGAVRALLEFLESHPQAGIAGSSFENADGTDWPTAFRFPSLVSEVESGLGLGLISRLLRPWAVVRTMTPEIQAIDWGAGASMMIRRTLLDKIGGLDENFFLYFEETEFCWRAKRAGFLMWYVPHSRVIHIGGQSTKVTERNVAPKRLPGYWFESRRLYFLMTGSFARAILADLFAIAAYSLGAAKLVLQRRRNRLVPYYVADLWRFSLLHRKNRNYLVRRTGLPYL
jgi:N-acetylglucosaminyl-diphospho-decaprenol L-rhamnosyltransferase